MSVNTMSIEDAYQFLNLLHTQATGRASVTPTNTGEFISMANTVLQTGVDNVYNTISQVLSRTLYSVRPYERKFPDLIVDNARWGGITRKISMSDRPIEEESKAWNQLDGSTVDPWKIRKANVLEMRYYGTAVYQDYYTIYRDQLLNAFTGPAELSSFLTLVTTTMSNKWEQYLESLARATLVDLIAAKNAADQPSVIHLLTEYNELTGLNLTAQTIWQEANAGAFFRWMRSRINTLSRKMTERTELFQWQITGKELQRHTPLQDQRMYLSSIILDRIDTMVNTTTYHNEPLAYAGVYGVNFWQSSAEGEELEISATPQVLTATGAIANAENQAVSGIVGIIMDRDAAAVNVKSYSVDPTPFNAAGQYWDTWLNANVQHCLDLTEKSILLLLD